MTRVKHKLIRSKPTCLCCKTNIVTRWDNKYCDDCRKFFRELKRGNRRKEYSIIGQMSNNPIASNHQKPIQARRVYVSLKAFEHIMGGEHYGFGEKLESVLFGDEVE